MLEELFKINAEEDPVRPDLSSEFRISNGRKIYGLKVDNEFKAFICISFLNDIPDSVLDLDSMADINGKIITPYTVWSNQRGAGGEIIGRLLSLVRNLGEDFRVITLSPKTVMAERFHFKNNAIKLRENNTTVNFEYKL
jgi:hypothetical protein